MRKLLAHLTADMAVVMAVINYIDDRNPMMGFLKSNIGRIYLFAFCLLALLFAVSTLCSDSVKAKEAEQ